MRHRALRALAILTRSGLIFCWVLAQAALLPRTLSAEPLSVQVVHAELGFDRRTNEPVISFIMSEDSASAFAEITRKNVGQPMALRVDGRVVSTPVIREPIMGGRGQISGHFTAEEGSDLAQHLSIGAARLEFEIVSD
jgi:preprotein translocase subunit SecD